MTAFSQALSHQIGYGLLLVGGAAELATCSMRWSAIVLFSSMAELALVDKSGIPKLQKGPSWTLFQTLQPYCFNQLSTSSEPCLFFHSFSVL